MLLVIMKTENLKWGVLATGRIAGVFAKDLRESKTGTLVAVGSRSQESADRFGDEWNVPNRHGSYEALLADAEVDAVYISTPHPQHAEWAIAAARAGKHILCEKPLTLNSPDAMRVVEAAERHGVMLIEAFMYRCHPQTAKIAELVKSGELGEVRQIEATFSFFSGGGMEGRLHNPELGGGGILDVGCYTASFSRLVAGAANGLDFVEPIEVKAVGVLGEGGVDDYTSAVVRFPGNVLAVLSTGVRISGGGFARIIGTAGTLRVPSPWFCGASPHLILEKGGETKEITVETDRPLYAYEADLFAASVAAGRAIAPAQSGADAIGNMRLLDRWRKEIGVVYPQETIERQTEPAGGPLRVQQNSMKYGEMAGVVKKDGTPKPISKIALGTMIEGAVDSLLHGVALFDDFVEKGGTCFDTAYVYGGGANEKIVGHWLKTRGVRDDVVIIGKGAHTPFCTPAYMSSQLKETLDRLQTDFVDIYMMHRDNLDIPVDEWIDALNEEVKAGRMNAFGGSNWSSERVSAANEYAAKKGLQGFTALSNNFSLARMVDPIWPGSISSSDAQSRKWHTDNQISLFSWSSQARGFFARADKNFHGDPELERCWYSDDNFQRLERAKELAAKKGVSPVVIAAAYVLAQPFPIYALIGPHRLSETRDSLQVFNVELTPEEVRWLNLEN